MAERNDGQAFSSLTALGREEGLQKWSDSGARPADRQLHAQISAFKGANVEVVSGVLPPPELYRLLQRRCAAEFPTEGRVSRQGH